MEFLTLHQLSRELNKPEKVLRYKFKKLLKKNTLVEGEDFIREGYIDDKHFLFKINPIRFAQLTELSPSPLPDTNGYQPGTNTDTNGYQVGTKVVTNTDTKTPEADTNIGNQQKTTDANDAQESFNKTVTNEFIDLMKEQLREKDKQLKEKDDQLKSKDELLKIVQEQAKEKDKLMKPEGQWNHFRLEARGATFTAWINGTKAVEYTNPKFADAAPIGLQIHQGLKMKVEYRNVRLAELP